MPDNLQLLAGLAVGSVALGLLSVWAARRSRKRRRVVAHVTGLTVYPLKSCRGVSTDEADCQRFGLRLHRPEDTPEADIRDRHWLVTDKDYTMLTLRKTYRLSLISVSLHGDFIHLDAPDIATCKVQIFDPKRKELEVDFWGHSLMAVDCGEEVSKWLGQHLRMPGARLLQHLNKHPNKVRGKYEQKLEPENAVAFIDASPYMMVSEESLADANGRLPYPISMLTLRPNIIIKGCAPYEEEEWIDVEIGDRGATFTFMKPCTRCPVTLVDVDKGERYPDGEPMKTLKTFRPLLKENNFSPVMGNKYKVVNPGFIKVGDPVYATEK